MEFLVTAQIFGARNGNTSGRFELNGARAKADFPTRVFGFGQEGILAVAAEFANINRKIA
jgi:hypothetical protein